MIRRLLLALGLLATLAGAAPAQAPSAVPALPDSERRTVYSITNSTCACAVNFAIFGDSTDYGNWLEVWINGVKKTAVTDWTLTSPSGSLSSLARPITNAVVTFTTAQTGTVQIVGARRSRRASQFTNQPSARDINQVVTDLVAVAREYWDKVNDTSGRVIQAPPGETLAVLPTSSVRSGTYALFDTSGNMIQGATQGAVEGATVAALTGTATDVRVVTTGSVSFTTQTSRQWLVGTYLTVANSSDGSNYMHGPITAYTPGTGAVTINVQDTSGSTAFNSWNLTIAGTRGTIGTTGPAGATTIAGVPSTSHFAIFGPSAVQISDGGTTGYGLTWDYTTLKFNTTSPPAAYGAPINARLAASVSSNALTIALKDANGADATAASPIMVPFRDTNPAVGTDTWASVTAATSVSITSGSTMGFGGGAPGRIWVVGFYDAGTFRLGAIQNLSGTGIYPLGPWGIASSTAEGGAGAADTSQTFYTGTAVSAKAYAVLGYLTWETPLTNAGLWTAVPDRIQMFGPGVPLPGQSVQTRMNFDSAMNTGATALPYDDTIPQSGEGDQYMQQVVTPSSKANILQIDWNLQTFHTVGQHVTCALFQDATANALAARSQWTVSNTQVINQSMYAMLAGTISATTFKMRCGGNTGATTTFNGDTGARKMGGVSNSYMRVQEIMN